MRRLVDVDSATVDADVACNQQIAIANGVINKDKNLYQKAHSNCSI
jgi:hypothetical protein